MLHYCLDEREHSARQCASGVCDVVIGYSAEEPYAYLRSAKWQESAVLAVRKILFAPEQCEFVPVRTSAVRAEYGAVAALVAHAVHVEYLRHIELRNIHCDIGSVRTYIRADLAYCGASEAAVVSPVSRRIDEVALPSEQNNISAFKKIFIDQFAFAVQTYF